MALRGQAEHAALFRLTLLSEVLGVLSQRLWCSACGGSHVTPEEVEVWKRQSKPNDRTVPLNFALDPETRPPVRTEARLYRGILPWDQEARFTLDEGNGFVYDAEERCWAVFVHGGGWFAPVRMEKLPDMTTIEMEPFEQTREDE